MSFHTFLSISVTWPNTINYFTIWFLCTCRWKSWNANMKWIWAHPHMNTYTQRWTELWEPVNGEEDGGITLSTLSGESSAYLQQMLHVSHTMKERLHAESTLHSQHLSTLYTHAALKQHTIVRFLKTCSRTCYKPAVIRQMSLIFHPVLLTNIFASDLRWSDSTILISRNDTLVFYFYYIAE